MKKFLFIFFISLLTQIYCSGQDSTIVRLAPSYSGSSEASKYFIIYDGIPIFKVKKLINYIDTISIDSIIIHKQIIRDFKGKQIFNAFIEVRTKESVNEGLKFILRETDACIFNYPLANLSVNGKKLKWLKLLKNNKIISNPDMIEKVEFMKPNNKNRYGIIKLILRK